MKNVNCADTSVRADVLKTTQVLFEAGQLIELQVVDPPASYLSTDHSALAATAAELSGKHAAVYVVLNRLVDDKPADKQTTNTDITRRRWLLVDLDPKRESGISSTDAEKPSQRALDCCCSADRADIEGGIHCHCRQ